MKRADKRKNDFKNGVTNFFSEYRAIIFAVGLVIATAIIGIFWSTLDLAIRNDYDLEKVLEDKIGEYSAEIVTSDDGSKFIVTSGDLTDNELIILQRNTYVKYDSKYPLYYVDKNVSINEPIQFYEHGLIKRVEWSEWEEDEEVHEVVGFHLFSSANPDVTAIPDWDIDSEASYLDSDTYVVKGKIGEYETTVAKLSQLSGLAKMIDDINKNNNDSNYNNLLLHFVSGDQDYYYHTKYKTVLGESSFYSVNRDVK